MNRREFDPDQEEAIREPIYRKRNKVQIYKDEDFIPRTRKKSGKRFHRKPTPKDGFGEEQGRKKGA